MGFAGNRTEPAKRQGKVAGRSGSNLHCPVVLFYAEFMGFFITEKETERLLEMETRLLSFPDGKRQHTDFRITWEALDFIIQASNNFTEELLVDLSIKNSQAMGYSFQESFRVLLSYVQQALRKRLGIDP